MATAIDINTSAPPAVSPQQPTFVNAEKARFGRFGQAATEAPAPPPANLSQADLPTLITLLRSGLDVRAFVIEKFNQRMPLSQADLGLIRSLRDEGLLSDEEEVGLRRASADAEPSQHRNLMLAATGVGIVVTGGILYLIFRRR